MQNKELLVIYQAYINWQHYLEGSANIIDTVTDHKNLEYFTTTKKLTQRQVRWSEYLSCFNTKICFQPGRLGTKPATLSWQWDVYQEEGKMANSTTNIQPIFMTNQLGTTDTTIFVSSLTQPEIPYTGILDHVTILDIISSTTTSDTFAQSMNEKLNTEELPSSWSCQTDRLWFEG